MKKILIYINQICLRGGVEKVFYNLINNLDLTKYDITVLTTVAYLKDDLEINIYGDKVKRYFLRYDEFSDNFFKKTYQRIYNKVMPKRIEKKILSQKWDIAISAQEAYYAQLVEKTDADKKLLWIHNDFNITDWSKKYFNNSREQEAECYRKFDQIVCVSESVKKGIEDTLGIKEKICVKYNPIDTHEIDEKIKEPVGVKRSDKPLLMVVGRMCEQKGYDRLLSAVKRLNCDGYDFDLWALGDGEDRESVEKYIADNNLTNVLLLGNRPNPFKYMNMADWIVCTSRFEGFNTAVQEAAYMGKSIFSVDCSGARELIGDSEFGVLTENTDEAIYEGLKRILDDKTLLEYYNEKIKERKSFVDIDDRIKEIEKLF